MEEKRKLSKTEIVDILAAKYTLYRSTPQEVAALQYDGTMEMALAIEDLDSYPYAEWDEADHFCGLRALREDDIVSEKRSYAEEGDYLIKKGMEWYLVPKDEFEYTYEYIH